MPIVFATLLAGIVSATATALFTSLRSRRAVKHTEDQRQADISAWLDGVPAVPGVTDGALPAPIRVVEVERGLAAVAKGQALLEKRMDEANGTGKRTEQMVREIRVHLGMVTG